MNFLKKYLYFFWRGCHSFLIINLLVTLITSCFFLLAGKLVIGLCFLFFSFIVLLAECIIYYFQTEKLINRFPSEKEKVVLYNPVTKNTHFITLDDVKDGDIIVSYPNERILVDGVIIDGFTQVEKSFFYGKNKVNLVKENDLVFSGYINLKDTIYIQVKKNYFEFFIMRLKKLIKDDINLILRLKKLHSGLLVSFLITFLLCFIFLICNSFQRLYFIGIIFWIICFEPFSFIHSYLLIRVTYQLQKIGVFLTKRTSLSDLLNLKNIVFIKTGVLTLSDFSISKVVTEFENDFWYYINCALYKTDDLTSSCIRRFHKVKIDTKKIKNHQIYENGYSFTFNKKDILVGNYKFLKDNQILVERVLDTGTILYVAVEEEVIGYLVISDKIDSELKKHIELIKNLNYNLVTFSKDDNRLVTAVSRTLGISDSYSDLNSETFDFWLNYYQENHGFFTMLISVQNNDYSVKTKLLMNGFSENNSLKSDIIIMDRDIDKVVSLLMYCDKIRKEISKILWWSICSKIFLLFSFLFITRKFYIIFILYILFMIPTIIRVMKISFWKRGM